ncbi:MAG: winged helix-turn-helix transcriptional regulator [Methanosarcinales archaeon]|nr:winged helix-turn-helix transcriptional regulator [Methanosarcinales archaeon]
MNAKILQSKSEMTKFQVLTEIAAHQPNVRQKEIANKIGITPQAVSEYIKELTAEGLIHSDGRVRYKITKDGVEWVLGNATELKRYSQLVMEDIISHVSTWTAICDEAIQKEDKVYIEMREGLLYANRSRDTGIYGTAIMNGEKNYDVGVTDLKGYMHVDTELITVCKIPRIKRGGSSFTNLERLKPIVQSKPYIGAVGTEALMALRRIGITPDVMFGASESVIQAAYHGLSSVVVVVEDEVSYLIGRLESENIPYEIMDLSKTGMK